MFKNTATSRKGCDISMLDSFIELILLAIVLLAAFIVAGAM